ncbi:unnamed protein product [Cyberlindnera jadinii]|uniref:Amino acid transporter n=1 Tax=Cyberlindnera jadinii (strain ATCC 18201 / CBS 1600 / BCRC 20928 / JCM 3617 / NBRC 0987 / NRRL Y-1542) TaxID=983966 RepID=A0A0H5C0N8_CYBJN|nr:unnamed protein product [Cyberlindnera jadinii]
MSSGSPLLGSSDQHAIYYSSVENNGQMYDDHIVNMDDEILATMGYKQELRRGYSTWEIFGIGFSIMGLLPSIASTLSMGLVCGPVGLVWGWFLSGIFLLTIGLSMSEMASSLPTSGGLYFWVYHFAPRSWKIPMSFFIGITDSMSLVSGLCSVTYGLAVQIISCLNIYDEAIECGESLTFQVFVLCILLQTVLTCVSSSALARLQGATIAINCLMILLFVVVLPYGTKRNKGSLNEVSYVFKHFENASDWPNLWSLLQFGMMPAIWTIGSFDACVYMSEEALHPSTAVPIGILGSITACWILGFVINIVICLCMPKDIGHLLNSELSQPLAQILLDNLGREWALTFMVLISVGQFLMGSSVLVAISRQIWSFARDDGLPFADYIKVINEKLATPIRAICISALVSILLGTIVLLGSTAANALFSLSVMSTYLAWVAPQILRFMTKESLFLPGKFYMGHSWSLVVNWIAIVFQVFIILMCCFPDTMHVTAETMNYTIVVNGIAWLISGWYYYYHKKHVYKGPKCNLEGLDDEEVEIIEEIIEGISPVVSLGPAPRSKRDMA